MLIAESARPRRGVTLVELMVVLVVGGLALGLIAAISMRQQRVFADLAESSAVAGQLRDAAAILPIDVRGASVEAGDIREARDTAIEVRATIASAVICDTAARALVLAPVDDSVISFGSYLAPIETGDTAWVYSSLDTIDSWRPYRVASTSSAAPGGCGAVGPALSHADRVTSRVGITLDGATALSDLIGVPIRVTRPIRYSLYRSSDGGWYLGGRDWSTATSRFNTIQPVSGPFLSPAEHGMLIQYYDVGGAELASPVGNLRAIATVHMGFRGQTRDPQRALGAAGSRAHVDSVGVALLLHNRR